MKRRRLTQVAVAYAGAVFVLWQVADIVFPQFGLPDAALTALIAVSVLGFPLALFVTWWVGPKTPSKTADAPKSIVVLPFDNLSPDPSDAYFSDGLTEEIITHLSQLRVLRVISRSSAMALKGAHKDVRTISRELDVQYVLEGSVRKAGTELRITAQLIDAEHDAHVWSDKFEATLDHLFRVQEQVSRAIVSALEVKLNPGDERKLLHSQVTDLRVWQCYLKARDKLMRGTQDSLRSALRDLQVAEDTFGQNELIYRGLAEVHLQSYEYGLDVSDDTLGQATLYARRLMSVSPESANSHYLKGRLERFIGNAANAAHDFERALSIDSAHTDAMVFLVAACSLHAGRPHAADQPAATLAHVDPLTPLTQVVLGWHHWLSGRYEAALHSFERTIRLEPDFVWASIFKAYVFLWQGKEADALAQLAEIERRGTGDSFGEWAMLLKRGVQRNLDGFTVSESVQNYWWRDPELPWFIAGAYARGGNHSEAFTWLERAVDRGWINYPLFAHQDPLLSELRSTPRFDTIMENVKVRFDAFDLKQQPV